MNQSERQVDLINNDGKKLSHKEIFQELFRERFDEILELTDEKKMDNLIYYFKDDISRKSFDEFENGIQLFEKIKSSDMKLEEAKKY